MNQERVLAAVMFTDIEGYTSLMETDEQAAILIRDRHREVFEIIHKKYRGKIIQYFGDGTLSTFTNSKDAVEAAMEMQQAFHESPSVPLRIGIHTGEVIYKEEDIVGDSVNVASRIESLGIAGSILISDKVFDDIKNQKGITTQSVGVFEFKNVERPREIFAISNEPLIVPDADILKGKTKLNTLEFDPIYSKSSQIKVSGKKVVLISVLVLTAIVLTYIFYPLQVEKGEDAQPLSMAIVPLENINANEKSNSFLHVITDNIYSRMTKIDPLDLLIDNNSAQKYKNSELTPSEIASELNVRYLLIVHSPLARSDNQVNVELFDTKTTKIIWEDKLKGDFLTIFNRSPAIVEQVAKMFGIKLSSLEREDINTAMLFNDSAFDSFLDGKKYIDAFATKRLENDLDMAENKFREAIVYYPEYGAALHQLSDVYFYRHRVLEQGWHWADSMEMIVDRHLALNPRSAEAHRDKHLYYLLVAIKYRADSVELFKSNMTLAKQELELSSEISPHLYKNADLSIIYDLEERYDSALFFVKRAVVDQPNNAEILGIAAWLYSYIEQYAIAEQYFFEALKIEPDNVPALRELCNLYLLDFNYTKLVQRSKQLYILNPAASWDIRSKSLTLTGELDKAEALIRHEIAKESNPWETRNKKNHLAFILKEQGKLEESEELLNEIIDFEINIQNYSPYTLASRFAVKGDNERAIQLIVESYSDSYYKLLQWNPWFKNIIHDNRITSLMNNTRKRLQDIKASFEQMELSDELRRSRKR